MAFDGPLTGRVALVAGATRGDGRAIAVELARAGACVSATGRGSRVSGPSELGWPEPIEETGDLMRAAGGDAQALVVDHLQSEAVERLPARISGEHGRLDLLMNDMFGGDRYVEWDRPLWEHDLEGGLRMLRMGIDTHLITGAMAMPLLLGTGGSLVVEMTEGTWAFNASPRRGVGLYDDLVKATVDRIVKGLALERDGPPVTVVGVTPGWLRSERMLAGFGVTEANWQDACCEQPHFAISESPTYVARGVAALARGHAGGAVRGRSAHLAATGRPVRSHRHRRLPPGQLGPARGAWDRVCRADGIAPFR